MRIYPVKKNPIGLVSFDTDTQTNKQTNILLLYYKNFPLRTHGQILNVTFFKSKNWLFHQKSRIVCLLKTSGYAPRGLKEPFTKWVIPKTSEIKPYKGESYWFSG